jgi:hypothetical protein
MRKIDPKSFQPGEIVFGLQTNGTVDTRRFADFLRELSSGGVAAELPPFDLGIEEIWSGSLFGRLRLVFRAPDAIDVAAQARIDKLFQEAQSRHQAMDAAVGEAKAALSAAHQSALMVSQTLDAAERKRKGSDEQDRRDKVEIKWLTRAAVAFAAAALIHDFAANAKKDEPSGCAQMVAELMLVDGVSKIDLWCDGHHVQIGHADVPLYRRRAESEPERILRSGGRVGDRVGSSELPGDRRGVDVNFHEAPDNRPNAVRDGADEKAPRLRDIDQARGAVRLAGIARPKSDDVYIFSVNASEGAQDYILVPPDGHDINENGNYEVLGQIYRYGDNIPILVAASLRPIY